MNLDFTSLANAVTRLDEGLARHLAEPSDTQLRDGLIQRFEFTYDLSHKMLRRVLEASAADPGEIDRMSFPTMVRTGFERGLTSADWSKWQVWREMRNITSHSYNEEKAREVAEGVPAFLAEAKVLLERLSADE